MDVAFVVVPFADVERPAIGVSLLSAEVAKAGFSSSVQYLNFDLAERIGKALYTTISESLPSESLIGEWFFADVVFGDALPPDDQYLNRILSRFTSGVVMGDVQRARRVRRDYIEACARKLLALQSPIIGFSTTFHQTCCCLAIARRIKQEANPPVVVFGGANCEGEMGLQMLRSFSWIDYVCTREGDIAFPALVGRLLGGGDTASVPGILKQGQCHELTTPELIFDLDDLPVPDYSDYFSRVLQSSAALEVKPELLIESSRGCWWGAKHHCTFCGLNGDTMKYRSKSPRRVFDELMLLTQRHQVKKVDFVDNILDMRYVDTLFPMLAEANLPLELFFEVKANLKRSQIRMLRAGGVRTIQPGIESFSNDVLRLMQKGCTGLQNIQLLRWCAEEQITVAWNLLAGFPGESPSEYARQAALLPLLTHLQPPSSCSPIRLDRFSPLFTKAAQAGLKRVRPTSAYYYVYPLGRSDLSRLAYFFDFDYPDGRNPNDYLAAVRHEVEKWLLLYSGDAQQRPRLDAFEDADDSVRVVDTRPCSPCAERRLSGIHARIYLACDEAKAPGRLAAELGGLGQEQAISTALNELIDAKLMIEMEGRYLSLAVLRNRAVTPERRRSDVYISISKAASPEPLPSPA